MIGNVSWYLMCDIFIWMPIKIRKIFIKEKIIIACYVMLHLMMHCGAETIEQ